MKETVVNQAASETKSRRASKKLINTMSISIKKILFYSFILLTLCLSACIEIEIPTPARQVTLVVDGQHSVIQTEAETVRDFLTESNIVLEELDYVNPPETTRLTDAMTVNVTRVLQFTETFTATIAFGRQVMRDANIPDGESRLLQSGKAGAQESVYRITVENNLEVERTLVKESITVTPQDEVLLIGTRPQVQTVPITGTLVYLGNQDAWVMHENNRAPRRLTTLGDLDGRVFTLAPTGDRLLFTRAVTETEQLNALWLLRTTEADPNPIPLNVRDVLWADWHPDGETLAWTTAEVAERAPGWRGKNDLWTARLTARNTLGSRRTLLKEQAGSGFGWWGTRFVWSPDGTHLAYSQPDNVGVVNVQRAEQHQLIRFPAYQTHNSWAWNPAIAWDPQSDAESGFLVTPYHASAPDSSDPEESPVFDLWLLESSGAYSAEVASEVGMWAAPHFTLDGEQILFGRAIIPYQSDISSYKLCLIDRDGSNARCLYPPENIGEAVNPSGDAAESAVSMGMISNRSVLDSSEGVAATTWQWSPDNASIAFILHEDIYLLLLDESDAFPITDVGTVTLLTWR